MQEANFDEALEQILAKDQRYHRDAYFFIREALDHTQRQAAKTSKEKVRHVSGQELLEGIRAYALEQYGPMTKTVLNEWGVQRCEDFGELVFNMVENNLLAKTKEDSRDDFKGGYTFENAFVHPFVPAAKLKKTEPKPESTQA